MPQQLNPLIESEFTTYLKERMKFPRLKCKHCTYDAAKNNSRALDHLTHCTGYQQMKAAKATANESDESLVKRQKTLTMNITRMPQLLKQTLDMEAAMAVYMGARPFRLYEDEYMKKFCYHLSTNLYTPPSAALVGGPLLDAAYEKLKEEVDTLLRCQNELNFVLDESPNINSARMVNLSVVIPQFGSIFIANENIGREDLDSTWFKNWFIQRTRQFDLKRVSSLTTDTCATMRSTWRALEKSDELSHAIFIPCDSHGLQLLIKDLIEMPRIAAVIKDAQQIATSFHKAKKQYAILRSLQDKPTAIVLSVITRWGTQLMLIRSLLRCQTALYNWLADPRAQMGKSRRENSLHPIITSATFWANLASVERILSPIHEAQKMSESDSSTLADVVPRWAKLAADLRKLTTIYPDLMGDFMSPAGKFLSRQRTQLSDVHFAAAYLLPLKVRTDARQSDHDKALRYIIRVANPIERTAASGSFIEFRSMSGVFASTHISSIHFANPVLYWKSFLVDGTTEHKALAQIAVRIFSAVANSVSAERSFSAMNLVHSKLRNRLGTDKANKQIYIYLNRRVLDRNGGIFMGDALDKTTDAQLELESELLELLGDETFTDDESESEDHSEIRAQSVEL